MPLAMHLNLDGAWDAGTLDLPELDLRSWGPRLRYCAPSAEVQAFYRHVKDRLPPFVLYGSGDFHYLTALLLRRVARPVTLVSFDNHPDWDRRPPRWCCGGWLRRALESGSVEHISVWGCGSFELRLPSRLFGACAELRVGRLSLYAWAERQDAATQRRFDCITRQNWRDRFDRLVGRLAGRAAYVTVDLDCLRSEEAVTNWENGLFSVADLVWAIARLAARTRIVGGDLCGAYSPPRYARWTQRVASQWDHPKLPAHQEDRARTINRAALRALWPVLTAGGREA